MALGATRARTVMTVILPTAVGGIVTATIVAVARAAGETAPLLFTTSIFVGTTVNTDPSQAMASIPMVIFSYSESPDPHDTAAGVGGGPGAASPSCSSAASSAGCCPFEHAARLSRSDEPLLHIFTTATPGHNPGSRHSLRRSTNMSTVSEPDRVERADASKQEDTAKAVASQSQAKLGELAARHTPVPEEQREPVLSLDGVTVSYSGAPAVCDVSMDVFRYQVTAFIGPSGCGKTTLLRSLNRMNDLITGATVDGKITYHGHDLYGSSVDPVEVRRRIGMVFQRPNPFPKSIFDNVAFGLRLHGMKDNLDDRVEQALHKAALWDEVKDRLKSSALALSGGQQQRLCIARALAIEPEIVLMDEPASALDPIATQRIEDLVGELKQDYTIVIVTHNMQQAARVADMTAFFSVDVKDGGGRNGVLVEYAPTADLFIRPSDSRTEAYVTGRFG